MADQHLERSSVDVGTQTCMGDAGSNGTNDVVDIFPSATDSSVQTAPPLSLAVTKSEVPYWALCPAKQSVLLRVANAMGINFMVFSTTRIQDTKHTNRHYNASQITR